MTSPAALAALKLTFGASLSWSALVNAVMGTLIAWVLVRDDFPGKGLVNSLIDLPFALPTIVAGLTLLALYGPRGADRDQHRVHAIGDRRSRSSSSRCPSSCARCNPCGTSSIGRWRRLRSLARRGRLHDLSPRRSCPNLVPAILSGVVLAFARAVGEFGAIVLVSGNIPVQDAGRVGADLLGNIESDRPTRCRGASPSSCSRSPLPDASGHRPRCRRWGSPGIESWSHGLALRRARLPRAAARAPRRAGLLSRPSQHGLGRSGTR